MKSPPKKSREGRKIYWRTVLILALILVVVAGAGFRILYVTSLDTRRENLAELARAQARIIESVAKFDAYFQSGPQAGAGRAATLSQFKEGLRAFRGFGSTGEILLAERVGDQLVYLLPARKLDYRIPPPVNLEAEEAGPMEAAINGGSGTMIDIDYAGDRVLAAYQWLPFMEMGLVTKIDMAEVNAPFYRTALITAVLALIAIVTGAALNAHAVSPLIDRIVEDAETIRERELTYRQLVDTIPGVVYKAETGEKLRMLEISDSVQRITGYSAADFTGEAGLDFFEAVLPEDRPLASLRDEGPFNLDYRIKKRDGEILWVADHGSILKESDGRLVRKGIILDITARKTAEHALEELPRKLSRYISPQVYKSIFQGKQDVQVGNTRKKLTVFFSDVVNFTQKSESLDPDDLTFIINSYLNRMAELAVRHGGTLDKFIGDGIVIFFGDPETQGVAEDAGACVRMALNMLDEVGSLNEAALRHGINSPIEIRVGIATGFCTVGNFGSESRMDYTVLGRTVNLAARLESSAPAQGILISESTAMLVRDEFVVEEAPPVTVKGFARPVPVSRVLGARPGAAGLI